jgi:hypothetical protein
MFRLIPRAWLAVAVLSLATPAPAAPSEADVKAAFLVSFTRFVSWPEGAGGDIVIVEPDSLGPVVERHASDAMLPMPLRVRRIRSGDAVQPARVLFVSKSAGIIGAEALRAAGPSVLTVGETEEFLAKGGIVRLAVEAGRVRVEINVDAAERSGLVISSQLLRVARLRRESELR